VDDGAVVFLDGTAVVYYGLPTNATYRTLATSQPGSLEDTWLSFPVDPRSLSNGIHRLAVEVHQASVTSSDLSFDLQLVATLDTSAVLPPKLSVERNGTSAKISWPAAAAGYVLEESKGVGSGTIWDRAAEAMQISNVEFFVVSGVTQVERIYRLREE
jgi:hypothetical protein